MASPPVYAPPPVIEPGHTFSTVTEISSISWARRRDTSPISESAWPAASDSFAPSTTPTVLFYIAATASWVSV